ncbi:transmembrane protein 214-like protein [Dinothrombium tinctorium]|uniref:Transmembrane protein 214-like protein n=1 Tax=Dinothrombium tinctorium TaxID=1965070 RepID=A0A3S3NZ24_9ACAR|nr:transmembrane protein 214-like protein [Dinothrombium tinctorium]
MSNDGWEFVGKKSKQGAAKGSKHKLQNGSLKAGKSVESKIQTGIEESETIFKVFLEEERRNEERRKNQQLKQQSKADSKAPKPPANDKKTAGKENVAKNKKKKSLNSSQNPIVFKKLDDAIRQINLADLRSIMEEVKTRFPESPLIWLKDLASYLNQKLSFEPEDPLFSENPSNYPLCLLPTDVLKHISKLFNECTKPTLQLFQDHCFQEIINHMTRSKLPTLGYRLMLQALGQLQPEITIKNLQRISLTRTSYQNRPPVCLSILWGASQSGYKNLSYGLKIWLELILPVTGMKAYSKYAIETLERFLSEHRKKNSEENALGIREFFSILDFAFTDNGLPPNLQKRFQTLYPQLKQLAFGENPSQNMKNFFPSFLLRLNPQISNNLKTEILQNLEYCLAQDIHCFSVWRQLYTKHLPQSSLLLAYLLENLNNLSPRFPRKLLKDTLLTFKITNEETVVSNKHEPGLNECRKPCEELLTKMSSRSFPWKKILSLLLVFALGLVAYDCHLHGSFEKSITGKYLKDSGVEASVQKSWSRARVYLVKGWEYLRKNVPIYYELLKRNCSPYVEYCYEQLIVVFNYLWDLTSDLRLWLDRNGPIFMENAKVVFKDGVSKIDQLLSLVYGYLLKLLTFAQQLLKDYLPIIMNNLTIAWTWLLENVFV